MGRYLMRFILHPFAFSAVLVLGGCGPMWNPTPPRNERQTLGEAVQLTGGAEEARGAEFSADGRWIVYNASDKPGAAHVCLAQLRVDGDGGAVGILAPMRVTPVEAVGGTGIFSPDGRSIFISRGPETKGQGASLPQMRIYRADGWQGAVAALLPGKGIDLTRHPITPAKEYCGQMSISPDGRWVIFVSEAKGRTEIAVMGVDGSDPHRLTAGGDHDAWPGFSPDGRQLLFQRVVAGRAQVMIADIVYDMDHRPTGIAHPRPLTRAGGMTPCWHPDGRHVVFAAPGEEGDTELYIIRTDGSRLTRLTFTAGPDAFPAVSPDGGRLIWSSGRGGKAMQLFVAKFKLPAGS